MIESSVQREKCSIFCPLLGSSSFKQSKQGLGYRTSTTFVLFPKTIQIKKLKRSDFANANVAVLHAGPTRSCGQSHATTLGSGTLLVPMISSTLQRTAKGITAFGNGLCEKVKQLQRFAKLLFNLSGTSISEISCCLCYHVGHQGTFLGINIYT